MDKQQFSGMVISRVCYLLRQGNTSLAGGGETSDMNHVAAGLGNIFHILDIFTDGYPSVHFVLDLKKGEKLNVSQ